MATSVKVVPMICALALLVGVKPAMAAETARPNFPHLAPGKVQETIAPAATVVSTVHYQAYAGLSCFTSLCLFSFPKPGRKHRLNLTGLACDLHGTDGSTFDQGFLELRDAVNNVLFREYVPVDFSSSLGVHTLNRAVDMQIGASQYVEVQLFLATGSVLGAICSITGTMDTLG